ncbi:hypothetical protein ACTXK7_07365 [Vreelandella alkaliphila]|uniref:hypothetical protein n=1 Tax=Vreelandella alkaliphila TaxID=272774 RepID=UPI003FD883C4
MANPANRNAHFLASISETAKQDILDAIARHYGITPTEAYTEVTRSDAEDLLEYMVEPQRSATQALMQRHGRAGSSELNNAFDILLKGTKYEKG